MINNSRNKIQGIIVSTLLFSILLSVSFAEVAGIKGDPVATQVVEWKDMVARDQALAKQGIVQQPTVIPYHRSPGPKQIRTDIVNPGTKPELATLSAPNASSGFSNFAASLLASFSAATDNNTYIPPDTMGAAGPSHLMVMLNGTVRIQNKSGGVISSVTLNSFWGKPSGTFDPKIYYDEDIGRWITVACVSAEHANSAVLVGVSSTNDPTGAWYLRSFDADSGDTTWADYPGVGFNQKWIAITMNLFPNSGPGYNGVKMWVLDKTAAANPGAISPTIFSPGFDDTGSGTGFTLIPCHTFGTETNLFILDSGWASGPNKYVRVSRLTGAVGSPSWALVGSGYADVQDYASSFPGAPQFGSITTLDTGDDRIQNAVFRNGCMWYAQTGGLPQPTANRTVALWHQVTTTLTVVQQGMIDGGTSGMFYFYPSIAVTASNDIGLGFSGCASTTYASAYYTNQTSKSVLGTMQPFALLKAGEGTYVKTYGGGSNRWGDYSQTCIDPIDGMVWTIQEYAATPVGSGDGSGRWGTWWGKFDAALPVTLSAFGFKDQE
jgi:hypothetical protein